MSIFTAIMGHIFRLLGRATRAETPHQEKNSRIEKPSPDATGNIYDDTPAIPPGSGYEIDKDHYESGGNFRTGDHFDAGGPFQNQ